jgi:hydrogenase nickel incorporation protein HypA/HybF
MHELSIALSILDIAAEEAQKHGTCRLRAIHVKLGPLSGVEAEALRGAFEIARECANLGETELVVERTQILVDCQVCGTTRTVESLLEMRCSGCGTFTSNIVAGRELEVVALELE